MIAFFCCREISFWENQHINRCMRCIKTAVKLNWIEYTIATHIIQFWHFNPLFYTSWTFVWIGFLLCHCFCISNKWPKCVFIVHHEPHFCFCFGFGLYCWWWCCYVVYFNFTYVKSESFVFFAPALCHTYAHIAFYHRELKYKSKAKIKRGKNK